MLEPFISEAVLYLNISQVSSISRSSRMSTQKHNTNYNIFHNLIYSVTLKRKMDNSKFKLTSHLFLKYKYKRKAYNLFEGVLIKLLKLCIILIMSFLYANFENGRWAEKIGRKLPRHSKTFNAQIRTKFDHI